MTLRRHPEDGIIAVLKDDAQARASVQDWCQNLGISDATFYNKCRTKYAGLSFAGERNPGQWTGILRDGVGCVNRSARSAAALYSAWEAGPERVY